MRQVGGARDRPNQRSRVVSASFRNSISHDTKKEDKDFLYWFYQILLQIKYFLNQAYSNVAEVSVLLAFFLATSRSTYNGRWRMELMFQQSMY